MVLGFERFKRVRALLDPFHFTPEQFFSPVLAETDIQGELLYGRLRERWDSGSVTVIGDKVPLYTRVLPELLERFPDARVIVMVRALADVAASFDRRAADPQDWWPAENDHRLAVSMWNEALQRARDVEQDGDGERLFLVPYEPLLQGELRWLSALMSFIDLPLTGRLRAEQQRLAAGLAERSPGPGAGPEALEHIAAYEDLDALAWAQKRMEAQLLKDQPAVSPEPLGEDDEAPLSAEQLSELELEREQLLGEMRRPGRRRAGEIEVLEQRLLDQARELVRREGRVARAAKPRVTFILPHQRPTTGGVYVVEQFARHLAPHLLSSIVVREEHVGPVAGVEVRSAVELDPQALGDADVLVYPADMRDAADLFELPDSVGRPVMLFQGYGTPGSPVVEANLATARSAVAIAHWLLEDANRHGVPCTYVPQGLDRELFAPGPPSFERPARVSVMTHRLDWKGLEDALAALSIVRDARADVEVVMFGTELESFADSFLQSPTRAQVAEVLRSSAVHVVASWEEGFGLTGAEAIACGAALASTDTKGSRDYAVDGATALVSAPRDPEALARNVLALLDDAELRERLINAGQRHLHSVMPPWPEAARRMAAALLEL